VLQASQNRSVLLERKTAAGGVVLCLAVDVWRSAENEGQSSIHARRGGSLRGDELRSADVRDSQPRRHPGVGYERRHGPRGVVPGGRRRARAEVLSQGRGAAGRRRRRTRCRCGGNPGHGRRDGRASGLPPAGRLLDPLGTGARVLRQRGGRRGLLRRALLHARQPDGGPELAAVVQHRPALGLRHLRPVAGALVRRSLDR
jgi:hypothetical protein